MALILHDVNIYWNEDIDSVLVKVESTDDVLNSFFSIKDWDIIKAMHEAVVDHDDFSFESQGFSFVCSNGVDFVDLFFETDETRIHLEDFNSLMQHLFDLMIDGANEDHHSVRYEPWFEHFTQSANLLRVGESLSDSERYAYEASIAERGY